MDHNELIEGKISTSLLKFAFPFMLASLLQALYGAADLFVVGQFANSAGVSAVSTGSQLMQTITGIFLGISMGGTVLIGRRVGEKDDDATAKAIGTLSILFCIFALILTPLMLIFTDKAVTLMHAPIEAIESTRQYIFICSLGIPFIIGYNGTSSIYRGLGDSKTPVYFVALASILNIVGDLVFVGIFSMGAGGAALATIIAQGISFFTSLLYMQKKSFNFQLKREHFKIYKDSFKPILKVGCPLALQDGLVNISFLLITMIINSMGLVASASVGVVERIMGFAFLPPSAFSSAVATITAQNMGANKPKRALNSLKCGILYSLMFGIFICLYCQISPESLTSIFSKDNEVIKNAALYLRSFSIDCVLVSFVFCFNAYFSGCGNSIISLIHSLIATFAVRVPISYALSKSTGVTLLEIGFAAPLASLLSIIICTLYFTWLRKKKIIN